MCSQAYHLSWLKLLLLFFPVPPADLNYFSMFEFTTVLFIAFGSLPCFPLIVLSPTLKSTHLIYCDTEYGMWVVISKTLDKWLSLSHNATFILCWILGCSGVCLFVGVYVAQHCDCDFTAWRNQFLHFSFAEGSLLCAHFYALLWGGGVSLCSPG